MRHALAPSTRSFTEHEVFKCQYMDRTIRHPLTKMMQLASRPAYLPLTRHLMEKQAYQCYISYLRHEGSTLSRLTRSNHVLQSTILAFSHSSQTSALVDRPS